MKETRGRTMGRLSSSPTPLVAQVRDAARDLWQGRGGRDEIDCVLRILEVGTAFGSTLEAFEHRASAHVLSGDARRDRVDGPAGAAWLEQARALSGLGLVLPGASRAQRGLLAASMCTAAYGLRTRTDGRAPDGPDHLAYVNYFVAAVEKAFGHDRRAREALVWFLAAQVCGGYLSAGAAKLFSPVWRDGSAITEILRTADAGDSAVSRVVHRHPLLAKAIAWGTIAGELAFPLVLVAPRPVARGILAAGIVRHLGNARFTGFDRVIWSSCSTYPALAHVSRHLGPRTGPGAARARDRAGTAVPAGSAAGLVRAAATPRGAAVLAAGLGVAAVAGVAARRAVRARRQRMTVARPGELVRVGESRVHALARSSADEPRCEGPTVVFENGLGAPATQWGWVLRGLRPDIPYLAYDRPGIGWSPPVCGRRDAEESADGLLRLLCARGLEPPYVLVGHSVGGLLIRSFARRHPELVGGLVFVDAFHPQQFVRSAKQREAMPWIRQRMATTQAQAALGLLGRSGGTDRMHGLPNDLAPATREALSRPGLWRAARRELSESQRSWSPDARRLEPHSGPVAVLTAGESARRDPAHLGLQKELALLSKVSWHDVAEDAGHETLLLDERHAAHVVRAVDWVRARAAVADAPAKTTGRTR